MTHGPEASFPSWFVALVPRMLTMARLHLPGAPVDARRREEVSAVVAASVGNEELARIHRGWLGLLGPVELTEVDDEVLAWAAVAALAGPNLDLANLPVEVSPAARRAVAALVLHGVVAAATADRASMLVDRVAGRAPRHPWDALGDLAVVVVGAPLTLPTAAFGTVLAALGQLAPPAPTVDLEADPNLLAQLLAETLPIWLGSAWCRTLVAHLPVEVPVAVRSGLTEATVRIGRGRLLVSNGIAEDIWAVFDGEMDALLSAGSHSLARELRTVRPLR